MSSPGYASEAQLNRVNRYQVPPVLENLLEDDSSLLMLKNYIAFDIKVVNLSSNPCLTQAELSSGNIDDSCLTLIGFDEEEIARALSIIIILFQRYPTDTR